MTQKEIDYFKNKLEKEKSLIEEELRTVGAANPRNPGEWMPTSNDMDIDKADENELADKMGELEDNRGILTSLESQLKDVSDALGKIPKGTYGICEVSGAPIERERLEANPAARTSLGHMKETLKK